MFRDDDSPVLEYVPNNIKQKLRASRVVKDGEEFADEREDDEVFIVEKIIKRNKSDYLVQCVGYEPEWIASEFIPSFILENFHKSGKTDIPLPRIQSSSTTGSIVYNTLTWKSDPSLLLWTPADQTQRMFPGHSADQRSEHEGGPLTCNTRKDKDSRFHRHTAGIFIGSHSVNLNGNHVFNVGCWPCGVCVLWDELYGTESVTQLHGIITDWLRYERHYQIYCCF